MATNRAAGAEAIRRLPPELARTAEGAHLRVQEALDSEDLDELTGVCDDLLDRAAGPMIPPYLQLGRAYSARRDRRRSIGAYVKAFQSQLSGLSRLASAVAESLEKQDLRAAEKGLSTLMRLMPLDGSVHRYLGEALLEGRRLEPASQQLFFAHVLDPSDRLVSLRLAVLSI